MDIDRIALGVDFVEAIETAVSGCDVLIALIGPNWLSASDASGQPRLENPEDYVRLEIETALSRGVPVIPACVQDAEMPRSTELPDGLAPLARRNGLPLRDIGWREDVGRLAAALERMAEQKADRTGAAAATPAGPPLEREEGTDVQSAPREHVETPDAAASKQVEVGDARVNAPSAPTDRATAAKSTAHPPDLGAFPFGPGDLGHDTAVLSHLFGVSRDLVFTSWADPDQVAKWWGPVGFNSPRNTIDIDLRSGGRFDLLMVDDASRFECWIRQEVLELVEPELLVLRCEPIPEIGRGASTVTRVKLHDANGATLLTINSGPHEAGSLTTVEAGWKSSLDRLEALLLSGARSPG
jgi:uncharacterized protein YndB with AHSA1/START domain